jgi:hypothetical protein
MVRSGPRRALTGPAASAAPSRVDLNEKELLKIFVLEPFLIDQEIQPDRKGL